MGKTTKTTEKKKDDKKLKSFVYPNIGDSGTSIRAENQEEADKLAKKLMKDTGQAKAEEAEAEGEQS